MPPKSRNRRTIREDDEQSEEARRPGPSTQRGRRRTPLTDDEDEPQDYDDEGEEMEIDGVGPQDQVVKKLVRYALACEYQRMRITRTGISEKAIGKQRGAAFKRIFESAQRDLRNKFGMEMVPLPLNEKVTVKQKRAAAKTSGNVRSNTTANYILTSILPPKFKTAEIMPPSMISSQREEAEYMALCTIIVSLIALSAGGCLPDAKLNQHLGRLNIDKNTPVGNTNDVLSRMRRDGYINRVVDTTPDEETTDWYVGPRGKVEISSKVIRGFVHEMYGERAPEDLDKKLQRSLGLELRRSSRDGEEDEEVNERRNGDPGPSTQSGHGRRRGRNDDD